MRRTTAAAIGIVVILVCLIAGSANAGKPTRAAAWFGPTWSLAEQTVEQQSVGGCCGTGPRVTNPDWLLSGGCAWDADDQLWAHISGDYFAPGQTVTGTMCVYADWTTHVIGWRVHPGLSGSIALPGHVVLPGGCLAGPDYDRDSPLLSEVPGSGGGVADRVTFTFSVTNVSGHRIRNPGGPFAEAHLALAGFELASNWAGCPYPMTSVGTPLYAPDHDPQVWTWAR